MAISIQKARVIATKPEFELFRASLPKTLDKLTVAALKRDVSRARNLRDKYRQLAKKQARGGKEGERTHLKAEMFDEVLGRFQVGLRKAEKSTGAAGSAKKKTRPPGRKKVVSKKKSSPARKKTAAKKPAAPKKKTAAGWFDKPAAKNPAAKKKKPQKRGAGSTSKNVEDAAKHSKLARAGQTRTRTHLSARGKRQQAKRDSRS